MKIKKKCVVLTILLAICLFLVWSVSEILREWECCEYSEFKKANEVIQKIEDYRKCHGKLPDSLDDVGYIPEEKIFGGPIFYDREATDRYIIWFGAGGVGNSCVYHSETGKWTPSPVG
ncbi:MAG: hypothetical protein GY765_42915 [bacterium]|nr:hypothetical protein [bacterium]